jgi:hypothetical protein
MLLSHESWVKYAVELLHLDKIRMPPEEVSSFNKEKADILLRKLQGRYSLHVKTRIKDTSKCKYWVHILA